jgi:hypothetical protein
MACRFEWLSCHWSPDKRGSVLQHGSDRIGDPFEILSRREAGVVRSEGECEPVALEPGNQVQVHVEDLLASWFPTGEKQVDAFASKRCLSKGHREILPNPEELRADAGIQIRKIRNVFYRHNEQVARVHRLDVEEGADVVVSLDDARGRRPSMMSQKMHRLIGRLLRTGHAWRWYWYSGSAPIARYPSPVRRAII